MDISPDGKHVLSWLSSGPVIASSSLDGTVQNGSKPVVQTGERVSRARFSPDGHWILYSASPVDALSSGLFVQPFDHPGLRTQIARVPALAEWRKDGREILYVAQGQPYPGPAGSLWSVRVDAANGALSFGTPEKLFTGLRPPAGLNNASRPFAVSRDGLRIYSVQGIEQPDSNMIHVKMGWKTEGR